MSNPFEASNIKQTVAKTKETPEQELTTEELINKMRDPSFLPPHELVYSHFKKFKTIYGKSTPDQIKWENFLKEGNKIFEIWTKEYINAFGDYLAQRVQELGGTKENPTVVLEIGAGDGRLTHFLQQKMNEIMPGQIKLIASDSGKWEIPPSFPVENINSKEAIQKHKPNIIICSWMPNDIDLTSEFRAIESVDEYILIGKADDNINGDPWKTWGVDWAKNINGHTANPPYMDEGFERTDHNDLKSLQLSRIEILEGPTGQEDFPSRSTTVSFKREKSPL